MAEKVAPPAGTGGAGRAGETAAVAGAHVSARHHSTNGASLPAPNYQELAAAGMVTAEEIALLAEGGEGEETDDASPLAVGGAQSLDLGWVDRYAKLMHKLTGSPVEFHEMVGLTVAASAIQRRARLRMAFGDVFPNLYSVLIAPSSVYGKTTALDKGAAILQRAGLERLRLAEMMTSEGLLKQLAEKSGGGLIVNDEIGRFFSSHTVKHLQTLKPDLTSLYDCRRYTRRLSHEEVTAPTPYLNILGATTPTRFFDGVSWADWHDGFLVRWLYVLPQGEPDFDATTGLHDEGSDRQIGELAVTLANIDRQRETDFAFGAGAFDLWNAWQREHIKNAYHYGDEVITSVTRRYGVHALKFAMILTALNGEWGCIEQDTMQTAIHLADRFKGNVDRLLKEKANFGISGAKLQKVFQVLRRKGAGDGLARKTLMQYAHMRAADLTLCLEKLMEIGAITEHTPEKGATRYRSAEGIETLPVKAWR